MHDKFNAYLLNVESRNSMFSKTYNTEFDEIIITFTDQNSRPLEEDKVNLKLLILWNQEQENPSKNTDVCHLQEIYLTNIEKS